MRSGFGSKGFYKSPVQFQGIRTYSQKFAAHRSAFTSIIPAYANLNVWSAFDPKSYTITTSGSTNVISAWRDVISGRTVSQPATSSMPILDFAIGNKSGLRFILDDWLYDSALDSTGYAPSGSTGYYMTYGIHMRTEQNNTVNGGPNNYFMCNPTYQATFWTNEWYNGFTFWEEGGTNKRFVFRIQYSMPINGNRGYFLISNNIGPNFPPGVNLKNYLNDYIYYYTLGVTSNRTSYMQITDKYGTVLFSTSSNYDDSTIWAQTTSSWDSFFVSSSGPGLGKFYPVIGRKAGDVTHYTTIQFATTTVPDTSVLKKTTQYLESIYGVM